MASLGTVAVPLAAGRAPSGWLLVAVGLAMLATLEGRSAAALRDFRAGRAFVALLVPPDPDEPRREPEEVDDDGSCDG